MTRTLALGRLVWRPATIFALGPLSFALLWPAFVLEKQFDNGLRAGLANGTPAVLWIESICFLGLFGALLASAGGAALQPLFSFTVPSLRSSVLRNKLIVGLLLASGLAIGLAYTGDIRGAPGIFSCALFFFSLPSVITDAAERDTLRWGAVALIVAASIQPFKVQALFQTAPAIATVVSFALAVMLLRRESSVGSARRRAIYVPTPVGYALGNSFKRAYASNSDTYSPSSHGPSRTIGTFAWIKAADYEVFGSRRFGWAKTLLWSALLYSGLAYGLGNPSFAATMGLLQISAQGHGLRGKWAYPISRTSRANLAFALCLGDSIAYTVISVVILTLLERTGLPRFPLLGNPVSHGQTLTLFPIVFIWAPIAQWLGATAIDPTQKRKKSTNWIVRFSVQWLAVILLVGFTYFAFVRLVRSTSFTVAVAAGAGLGISVQVCYWLALRRHFTRKDLV